MGEGHENNSQELNVPGETKFLKCNMKNFYVFEEKHPNIDCCFNDAVCFCVGCINF
jgi:hypothetical protein